jgi:hypothetical protein
MGQDGLRWDAKDDQSEQTNGSTICIYDTLKRDETLKIDGMWGEKAVEPKFFSAGGVVLGNVDGSECRSVGLCVVGCEGGECGECGECGDVSRVCVDGCVGQRSPPETSPPETSPPETPPPETPETC